MSADRPFDITVNRVRDRGGEPPDYRKVRRALAEGTIHRIAPGAFVLARSWEQLSPMERHRVRVFEAADRLRAPALISHFAAAAVHGIDILGPWPERVDVRVPRRAGGRSSGLIRRHCLGVDEADAVDWRGHRITTPAQTAVDIAALSDHLHAVVVFDQVLWARRPGGPLATLDELFALVERQVSAKGFARIRRALASASALADSVRESQSRVLIRRLDFPEPELQRTFLLPDRRSARSDFYFPDQDHIGEFDGLGKYLDPQLLQGRTPEQALIEEKDRADALRRMVRGFSRWRTPALRRPRELYDILTADGLRSPVPPPPAGLILPD
ncbi:hypothetical protein [Microbacterium sp.]|uniref:hypothetical protein n=1 Tax=Microbacterium sp. TaxID=51671 RepID=UPI002811BA5A|nr:hypothetical protein [Microbacterium sp.]